MTAASGASRAGFNQWGTGWVEVPSGVLLHGGEGGRRNSQHTWFGSSLETDVQGGRGTLEIPNEPLAPLRLHSFAVPIRPIVTVNQPLPMDWQSPSSPKRTSWPLTWPTTGAVSEGDSSQP